MAQKTFLAKPPLEATDSTVVVFSPDYDPSMSGLDEGTHRAAGGEA